MKITATNESRIDVKMFFYEVDYTVGDDHGDNAAYFHSISAGKRRRSPNRL